MKAAYINQLGGPEVIQYGDLPEPQPGPNQYLVRASAVDVNPIDTYIRSGAVPVKLNFPFILGRDLAGQIVGAGPKATKFKIGDRVWATGQGWEGRQGTFAEFAAVDEQWLKPIPASVADEAVAAISLVGVTAHVGLVTRAKLKAGETVFVNGGTGGVGSCVVQMANILGARVIATAGTDEKVAKARALGADLVVNYKSEDVTAAIKQFAPSGVNVWWETLREPDFEKTIPLLAVNARMIVMAGRDARPVFPVGPFYAKNATLHGLIILSSSMDEIAAAAEDINHWMASGRLRAQIDRILPLSQTAGAHRLQEESTIKKSGALAGKIVLKP